MHIYFFYLSVLFSLIFCFIWITAQQNIALLFNLYVATVFQPDGSLEILARESEIIRQAYGHLFDFVIVNNDMEETIRQLEIVVEKLHACPQWIPVSWVYWIRCFVLCDICMSSFLILVNRPMKSVLMFYTSRVILYSLFLFFV